MGIIRGHCHTSLGTVHQEIQQEHRICFYSEGWSAHILHVHSYVQALLRLRVREAGSCIDTLVLRGGRKIKSAQANFQMHFIQ